MDAGDILMILGHLYPLPLKAEEDELQAKVRPEAGKDLKEVSPRRPTRTTSFRRICGRRWAHWDCSA